MTTIRTMPKNKWDHRFGSACHMADTGIVEIELIGKAFLRMCHSH